MRKIASILFPFLFISLLVLFYFWSNLTIPAITYSPVAGGDDLTEFHFPMRKFLIENLREKTFRLWSDKFFCGFPIVAQGEMGAFYPLNLLSTFFFSRLNFFSTHYSLYVNLFFIFMFTGVTLYFYLKELGLTPLASLFGGVVFSFSGFMLGHQATYNVIAASMWLPICLILAEKFLKKRKFILMVWLGFCLAMAKLAGGNQELFYMVIFIFLYLLFLKTKSLHWFKVFLAYGIAGGFALSLSAIQLIPTIELISYSSRAQGVGTAAASFLAFPISNLVNFFFPYYFYPQEFTAQAFFQKGWFFYERYVYLGLIPWFFILILSIYFLKNRRIIKNQSEFFNEKIQHFVFFSLSALIFLFLSFGDQTFLKFVFTLPGFNLFRIPSKLLLFTQLGLVVLASSGFQILENKVCEKISSQKKVIGQAGLLLLILLAFFDIFIADRRLHPTHSVQDWFQTPDTVNYIKKHYPQDRLIWTYGQNPSYLVKTYTQQPELFVNHRPEIFINGHNLLPNLDNLYYDLYATTGYSGGMGIQQVAKLNYYLMDSGLIWSPENISIPDEYLKIAQLTSSRYLLVARKINDRPGLKKVFETNFTIGQENVLVYEIENPLPRAFVVDSVKIVKDQKKILSTLLNPEFQPDQEIILEEELPANFLNETSELEANVSLLKTEDNKIELEVESNKNCILFLSDTFYPGWQALVDGQQVPIRRANYVFRAVPIEKGTHQVIFQYQPKSYRQGFIISLVGLILFIFSIPLFAFLERKRALLDMIK